MPYTCTNEKLARMGASGASNAWVSIKNALRVTSTEEIRPAINTTCNGRIGASHAHAANLAHPRPALRRCLGRAPMNTDRGRGGRDQRATTAPRGRGGGARPRNLLDGEFGNSGTTGDWARCLNRHACGTMLPGYEGALYALAWGTGSAVFQGSEADAVAFVSTCKNGR